MLEVGAPTEARSKKQDIFDARQEYRRRIDANYALNLEEIEAGKTRLESHPPYFQIDLIGVCDMKPYCRMCTIDISHTRAHGGLALDVLHSYGAFADHCLQVTNCSTGEPLLHRELEGFLSFAQERDKRFGFSSNALALTAEKSDLLLRYGDALALNVSLDAASAESYAKVRCNEWNKVETNLRRFAGQRLRLPESQRPHFGLCFIPMRLNQHEVDAFFDLGAELGVDYIELRPLILFPANKIVTHDGYTFNYHEQLLNQAEIEQCRLRGVAASERTGVRLNWQYETSGDDPYVLFRPAEVKEEVKAPCTMPWTFLLPYENGDTVPCCYMAGSVGDWRQEGLDAVWNGPILQGVRQALAKGELANECLKSPSCPVVKKALQHGRGQRLLAYLDDATDSHGHVALEVSDAPFQELIRFGIYEEEQGADGQPMRWIAELARLELPPIFQGQPFELGLRLSSAHGDASSGPSLCKVSVNGLTVGEARAAVDGWATTWLPVPALDAGPLEIDFECGNAFVPKDLGVSKDRRLLGVMMRGLALRPVDAKQHSAKQTADSAIGANGTNGAELSVASMHAALNAEGEWVLSVEEPAFQELVRFGIYGAEQGADGEEAFRWLADEARLELPRLFGDRPFDLGLRLRAGKTDPRIIGAVCDVAINGQRLGQVGAEEDTWVTHWLPVHLKADGALRIDLTFPNAFAPKDYGHSDDGRSLGAVLAEVRMRPAASKGWWGHAAQKLGLSLRS